MQMQGIERSHGCRELPLGVWEVVASTGCLWLGFCVTKSGIISLCVPHYLINTGGRLLRTFHSGWCPGTLLCALSTLGF